jgi:hypothetical protein
MTGVHRRCMVGRFQVMALLQAVRAKALGYPLDEAESFGLNRAIFYAAAKRGSLLKNAYVSCCFVHSRV